MTQEGPTPEELLARFRERGEVAALGALFDATSPTLFRMALALAPDPASAEDAVQETFLTLMAPGSHYDPSRPLLPWMVGILQLKVHEARRRARRMVDPARLAPPVFPDDPSRVAESGEEMERIRAALDALPEPYRAVAILRWRYGLEPAAIADARNEPPGTIRSLLHRAQEKLRGTLKLMPAFLLAERVPRGMDAVRSAVMTKGSAVAAAAAVAGVATGGVLMASKTLVGAAVVLVAGGTAWFTLGFDRERPVPPAPPPVAVARPVPPSPPPAAPAPEVPEEIPDPPPGPDPSTLPPPVDLSKCDRDLDLFGTAVDEYGRPVPGARIETVTFPWRRFQANSTELHFLEEAGPGTLTAVDGTFSFRLQRGDTVDLRGTAKGYGQGDLAGCTAGERVRLVLRLGGGSVALTILDEDRRPVPDARARLWMHAANSLYGRMGLVRWGTSDAKGRCEFAHLPGGRATVTVEHGTLGNPDFLQPEIPVRGGIALELVLYRGRTVSGRVTDASTGRPIPGARVGSGYECDRGVTTDSEGRFAVPGVTEKGNRGLGAKADGYGTQWHRIPGDGEVEFDLDPAFTAFGRVVDADGVPVPGARVTATGYEGGTERRSTDQCATVTDAAGMFRLVNLSRRCKDHSLMARSPGRGPVAWVFRPPLEGENELDLGNVAMPVARAIEGRAVDPSGKPLVSVDVTAFRLRGPADPVPADPGEVGVPGTWNSRRTDDLGRFRFPDLGTGQWRLRLSMRSAPIVEATVDVAPDADVLDVVLAQVGSSLTILVTDGDGRPIPEIGVYSDMVFPNPSRSRALGSITGTTDAAGRVRFTAIPEVAVGKEKGIRFQLQQQPSGSSRAWAGVRTDPIVPDGQEVHIVLSPVDIVRGKVVGPEGEPIADVLVAAIDAEGRPIGDAAGFSDGRGEFAVRVGQGVSVRLKLTGEGHVPASSEGNTVTGSTPWRAESESVRAPAEGVVLRAKKLAVDGGLDLVVLDLDSRPVAGYQVIAWRSGESRSGKTDGRGRIHWEGMVEETWHLMPNVMMPRGLPDDAVAPAAPDVVPKGQEVLLRFRRGNAVAGVVLLPDGTPAAGAYLGFNLTRGGGGPGRPPKTDEHGRFRLWFGEGDEFRIQASSKDANGVVLRGETLELRPGCGEVEIRMAPE